MKPAPARNAISNLHADVDAAIEAISGCQRREGAAARAHGEARAATIAAQRAYEAADRRLVAAKSLRPTAIASIGTR